MAIVTRFGDPCVIVREAVITDVKAFENRKVDKIDRERFEMHMMFICRYVNGKRTKEFLADLAYLRATDGWREIIDEAAKIQPLLRGGT
jgi:hypothetical protein